MTQLAGVFPSTHYWSLPINLRLIVRLLRVFLHILQGLAICALRFTGIDSARRDLLVRRWSRQLLAICGVSIEDASPAPALTHALVVANHVSWLDIFVINALYPCRFVAKAEIRAWPVLGWLVARAGTVFIARGNRRDLRHSFKGIVTSLAEGERVAFFPEGTTGAQGAMLTFHANLFEAAIDAGVAVQPYAISYLGQDGQLHPAVDFVGEMSFGQSICAVLSARGLRARLCCLAPLDAVGQHRRALALAAHDAVQTELAA